MAGTVAMDWEKVVVKGGSGSIEDVGTVVYALPRSDPLTQFLFGFVPVILLYMGFLKPLGHLSKNYLQFLQTTISKF